MRNKKLVVYTLVIFIIGILAGVVIIGLNNKNKVDVNNSSTKVSDISSEGSHQKIVSGYSFEITEEYIIEKELDGEYLNSFVTIALEQEEFLVNLKGIDSTSEVFIINPNNGDMTSMKYDNERFTINVKLDKDITYGIIMDYKLVGSIRVVEDLNTIDQEQLFRDILINMGCGL